ncbi:hypothetical protein KOAAANKH_02553 [Brevundimonas sp. NIBR10]|nr:hypothetical protein KOAAANKH_02553 [Brevundimonas sp. NIBR10]
MKLFGTSVPATPEPQPSGFDHLLNVPPTRTCTVIPPDAKSGPWEDYHEWHKTAPAPVRTWGCVSYPEPPLAMICPECSARQPVISGRPYVLGVGAVWPSCSYCGLQIMQHGTRLFWWR